MRFQKSVHSCSVRSAPGSFPCTYMACSGSIAPAKPNISDCSVRVCDPSGTASRVRTIASMSLTVAFLARAISESGGTATVENVWRGQLTRDRVAGKEVYLTTIMLSAASSETVAPLFR